MYRECRWDDGVTLLSNLVSEYPHEHQATPIRSVPNHSGPLEPLTVLPPLLQMRLFVMTVCHSESVTGE